MNHFMDVARLGNGRSARFSSWDTTGRNGDCWNLPARRSRVLADIKGPGVITHIWMALPAGNFRTCLLKITWDDAKTPSVLCPLGDFFGLGHGMVNSYQSLFFSASANPERECKQTGGAGVNCYLPMPFRKRAVIEAINDDRVDHVLFFYVDYERTETADLAGFGYLHAEFHRVNPFGGWAPEIGPWLPSNIVNKGRLAWDNNYVILETKGRGHYLGCNYSVLRPFPTTWWGEGDDMIWVDGYKWPPDLHGTGSEDYFNHAWGMQANAFLRNGSSIHEGKSGGYQTSYVFHVENPVRFRKEIRATIEAGHGNHWGLDISSVAYWYAEQPTRIKNPPALSQRMPTLKAPANGHWIIDKKNQCPGKPCRITAEMKKLRKRWQTRCPDWRWRPNVFTSAYIGEWQISRLLAKTGNVSKAKCVALDDCTLEWRPINHGPVPDVLGSCGYRDGLVYLGNRFDVEAGGIWTIRLGHDGGAAVFVDGRRIICEPRLLNPVMPWRSRATVKLAEGRHEIMIAFDTDRGRGCGFMFCFERPPARRKPAKTAEFPRLAKE